MPLNKIERPILQIYPLHITPVYPGLSGVNIFAHQYPIEPFLVFTEFFMDLPVFGPHAHAGISVMTYMLPDSKGSFINRDSNGDFSIIEPGGLHITQAGSGMHHDEFPKEPELLTHGFQIWINHAEKDRFVAPQSFHARAGDIPEIISDGHTIRVLQGAYQNVQAPWQMVTDVCLLHIFLKTHQQLAMVNREMAFAYILKGEGAVEGKVLAPQHLITFPKSIHNIHFSTKHEALEFMFATALPLKEAITYGGSFVSTTPEQMFLMKQRFARGEMGNLEHYKTTIS